MMKRNYLLNSGFLLMVLLLGKELQSQLLETQDSRFLTLLNSSSPNLMLDTMLELLPGATRESLIVEDLLLSFLAFLKDK